MRMGREGKVDGESLRRRAAYEGTAVDRQPSSRTAYDFEAQDGQNNFGPLPIIHSWSKRREIYTKKIVKYVHVTAREFFNPYSGACKQEYE